jgi:hypothetical protein
MAMYRLNMKVGEHEFHGEGSEDSVKRDFEEWKTLLSTTRVAHSPEVSQGGKRGEDRDIDPNQLFVVDEQSRLVSLRAIPRGDDRDREAFLLILYGFKSLVGEEAVLVTQLKRAMRQTGCPVDRIDRIAAKYLVAGLVNKAGMNKGGRYSLTNRGLETAVSLAGTLLRGE